MIEPKKPGIFSDLAAASVLTVKYRALAKLVVDRQHYVSEGRFKLEGVARANRRQSQMRLSRQFPGALAELENLSYEGVSALIAGLRSFLSGEIQISGEEQRTINAVHDYHLILHALLTDSGSETRFIPTSLLTAQSGGGASRRVGSWVREKYGLGTRCRVWIFDIGWIRGS